MNIEIILGHDVNQENGKSEVTEGGELDTYNKWFIKLFGVDIGIDWRDERTVEINNVKNLYVR